MTRPAMQEKALTQCELAALLDVSERTLRDALKALEPCWLVIGGRKRFDSRAIAQITERKPCG